MSLSSSDIVPTMPIQPANNGGGFGWGNDMWFIILFVLLFCGWGGNWGNNNNGVASDYVLATDFATIERKLDGVNNGIADATFALNNTITNGFSNAELSRCNQQSALMQQLFAMQMQAQNCCCENREAIQGVNYNLATQSCDTRNTIQNATRDIIDAMNCGFRGIEQRLTAQELAAKDATIADQNQRLFLAELKASQETQTNGIRGYIDGQFAYYNPPARPAYIVPNPNCCNQPCCA